MAALILSLAALGILLILASRQRLRELGIPGGRLVSLDTTRLKPVAKPLYDPVLGLTGRPDYLIQQGHSAVPVEVKSGFSPLSPQRSHVLQVAAYCHLVETTMGRRPTYGILKYADNTYKMKYTDALRQDLSRILCVMRTRQDVALDRSHQSPGKCRACGYKSSCNQSLA